MKLWTWKVLIALNLLTLLSVYLSLCFEIICCFIIHRIHILLVWLVSKVMDLLSKLPHQPQLLQTGNLPPHNQWNYLLFLPQTRDKVNVGRRWWTSPSKAVDVFWVQNAYSHLACHAEALLQRMQSSLLLFLNFLVCYLNSSSIIKSDVYM